AVPEWRTERAVRGVSEAREAWRDDVRDRPHVYGGGAVLQARAPDRVRRALGPGDAVRTARSPGRLPGAPATGDAALCARRQPEGNVQRRSGPVRHRRGLTDGRPGHRPVAA